MLANILSDHDAQQDHALRLGTKLMKKRYKMSRNSNIKNKALLSTEEMKKQKLSLKGIEVTFTYNYMD